VRADTQGEQADVTTNTGTLNDELMKASLQFIIQRSGVRRSAVALPRGRAATVKMV
jgi:hypothetical protein